MAIKKTSGQVRTDSGFVKVYDAFGHLERMIPSENVCSIRPNYGKAHHGLLGALFEPGLGEDLFDITYVAPDEKDKKR